MKSLVGDIEVKTTYISPSSSGRHMQKDHRKTFFWLSRSQHIPEKRSQQKQQMAILFACFGKRSSKPIPDALSLRDLNDWFKIDLEEFREELENATMDHIMICACKRAAAIIERRGVLSTHVSPNTPKRCSTDSPGSLEVPLKRKKEHDSNWIQSSGALI